MSKKDPKEPIEEQESEVEEDADLVWKEEEKEEESRPKDDHPLAEEVEGETEKEDEEVDEEREEAVPSEVEGSEESKEDEREAEAEGSEEDLSAEEDVEAPSTHEEIKKSDILRRDLNQFVRDNQPSYNLNPQNRSSFKKLMTLILFILAIVVIGGGIYFIAGLGGSKKQSSSTPTPSATAEPTPTPRALDRLQWSLEVLNGSGVTGAAKKLADQLKALGYPVVKTGNADRDDYTSNEFFVKKELEDSVELFILDIKDIIKIASVSGELKDSTASARIIIGK